MNRSITTKTTGYISPACQINTLQVEQGFCTASNEGFEVQPLGFGFEDDPVKGFIQ